MPGELVPAAENETAFVPHPLPPRDWSFPTRLWPLLSEAKGYVRELEGIGSVLPNPAILLRPLSDREAIQSSALEGTYATPKQLLLYELQPAAPSAEKDRLAQHREVYNYTQALQYGISSALPLSLRLLREMHRILLSDVRGREKTPGEFRKIQVAIGSTHRFVPPPPDRVPECLDALEKFFHADGDLEPLVHSFLVHYQLETIHPFVDGNGRVGRLLLALMLQQRCKLTKPWLYMSEYFERHHDEYTSRLFHVSAKAEWSEWIEFCLQGTLEHAQSTIARCRKLLALREKYQQSIKTVGGHVRLHEIIEGVFRSPFVRITSLATELNVTYPTAKADVERLVQAGVLQQLPNVQPKTFFAPEVFSVAYDDIGAWHRPSGPELGD